MDSSSPGQALARATLEHENVTVDAPNVDRHRLAKVLGLAVTQRITLAPAVGYPGREA